MEKAFATAVLPTLSGKKTAARVALIDLKEPARNTLAECFRQFGIESVSVNGNAVERLKKDQAGPGGSSRNGFRPHLAFQ